MTNDDHQEILSLHAEGKAAKDIAKEIGCHVSSVYNAINREGGGKKRKAARAAQASTSHVEGEGDVDQGELLTWYEAREKELLEKLERVTDRLMRAMDTIEALKEAAG